jgi:hypothetical protein
MGGFKGIMMVLGSVMMKTFNADITRNLENMAYNIKIMSKSGRQSVMNLRQDANTQLRKMYADSDDPSGPLKADVYTTQAKAQDAYLLKQQEMLRRGKELTVEE